MSRSKSPALTSQSMPAWAVSLGACLRDARTGRKESLAAVSEATGVSTSFLSLLEQGRTDVSLGRLLPLLEHYGLELSDLVSTATAPGHEVIRDAERPVLFAPAEGVKVTLAARDQRRAFVPLVVECAVGASTAWSQHDGEEFLIVLEGILEVEFTDAEPVLLHRGDAMFFASQRAHRMGPSGDEPARALVVTTTGHR